MVKHNIVPALIEIILQFKHTKLNVVHVSNMNNYIQSNMSLLTRPPFLISQASFATFHPSLPSPPSPPIFPPLFLSTPSPSSPSCCPPRPSIRVSPNHTVSNASPRPPTVQ